MTKGWRRDTELKALVADFIALGYSPTSIARVLGRTPERINQVRGELGMTPPRMHSVSDVPESMRERVSQFLASESEGSTTT